MNAIEFTTELSGASALNIPSDVAAELPKSELARVIVLTDQDPEESQWRRAAYEQFLRDDSEEDAFYDSQASACSEKYVTQVSLN